MAAAALLRKTRARVVSFLRKDLNDGAALLMMMMMFKMVMLITMVIKCWWKDLCQTKNRNWTRWIWQPAITESSIRFDRQIRATNRQLAAIHSCFHGSLLTHKRAWWWRWLKSDDFKVGDKDFQTNNAHRILLKRWPDCAACPNWSVLKPKQPVKRWTKSMDLDIASQSRRTFVNNSVSSSTALIWVP